MANYSATDEMVIEPKSTMTDDDLQKKASSLPKEATIPSVDDLSTWESFDDQVSYDAALEMHLPVATVDSSYSRRVLIRDVRQYASVVSNGFIRDYGVAVRLVITVYAVELKGDLTLPIVAAKAQLGLLNASARISVLGFRGSEVGKLLPDFETLDVGNYGKYTESANAIRTHISEHPDKVFPVLLKTVQEPSDELDPLTRAAAAARALRMVERRRPLSEALAGAPDNWPTYRKAIEDTYRELQPGISASARPGDRAADRARQWLAWV